VGLPELKLFSYPTIGELEASLPWFWMSGRHMRVRAEDVLNHTDTQLRAIAAWQALRIDTNATKAMKHPEKVTILNSWPARQRDHGRGRRHLPARSRTARS
jgi:hypothetical protein